MLITKVSEYSGIERTINIPIAELDYQKWLNGALIQRVAPYISKAHREFMKSGMYGDEFEKSREAFRNENQGWNT